jgi:hypothetical protein
MGDSWAIPSVTSLTERSVSPSSSNLSKIESTTKLWSNGFK